MNIGKIAVQAIREWNPLGPEAFARRDRNKAYRKARRKAKRGEVLTEDEYETLNATQEVSAMNGFKTYTGIAVAALGFVLGLLGVGESDSAALSSQIVAALDQVLTVGGLLFAAYGRAKAKPAA
jgi:hypothetical protein